MTSTNIRESWIFAGFSCERREDASYLVVNEREIRESKGFGDIQDFDCHPARLPPERLSLKSGCLNQNLFRVESQTFSR
jgi:hypothetical protein